MKPANMRQKQALLTWRKLPRADRDGVIDFLFDDAKFQLECDPTCADQMRMVEVSLAAVRLLEAIDRVPERSADWIDDPNETTEGRTE